MKNYKYLLILIIMMCFVSSCNDRRIKPKGDEITYNYVILLDLSDRLLGKNQPLIDKELITYIYSLFEENVKKKIFIYSKDQFKIVVAEQKKFTVDPILLQNSLNFELSNVESEGSKNYISKRDYMINFKREFVNALDKLYKEASTYTVSKQFKGADIWKYFNQNLELDIKTDPNIMNYVFVITDGYFDFEDYQYQKRVKNRFSTSSFLSNLRNPNWEIEFDKMDYGLIPIQKKFNKISLMVLEINPKYDFVDEFDLLKTMWTRWLKEMGIDNSVVLKKNRIETTKDQINKFLKNR